MRILCSYLAIILSYASLCFADDSYSEVQLTAGDLKGILELNVQKHRVDFKKSGYPTLVIKGLGGDPIIVTLSNTSKSATIITYLERAPYSVKPSNMSLDTIHYWFSNNQQGISSHFQFYADKANYITYGLKDGIYTVVATKSKGEKDEIGYTLQITSESKRRTSESR